MSVHIMNTIVKNRNNNVEYSKMLNIFQDARQYYRILHPTPYDVKENHNNAPCRRIHSRIHSAHGSLTVLLLKEKNSQWFSGRIVDKSLKTPLESFLEDILIASPDLNFHQISLRVGQPALPGKLQCETKNRGHFGTRCFEVRTLLAVRLLVKKYKWTNFHNTGEPI